MADLELPYRKTLAGADEIASRKLHLTRAQRVLLIVARPRHPLGRLCSVVGCDSPQLSELADDLLRLGLIEPVHDGSADEASPTRQEAPVASVPMHDASAIRTSLVSLVIEMFAADAGPLVLKLERSTTVPDLAAAAESIGKLAKLTIDEDRAKLFLAEARRRLSEAGPH